MNENDQREAEQLRERMTLCPGPSRAPVIGHVTPLAIAGTATNDAIAEPSIAARGRHVAKELRAAADRIDASSVAAYPPAMLERLQAEMDAETEAERVIEDRRRAMEHAYAEERRHVPGPHAPRDCPTSGLACEVCDETANAPAEFERAMAQSIAFRDAVIAALGWVPGAYTDEEIARGVAERGRQAEAPVITPAIARDLIAEGQEASAEYMERVRRAEQPDAHAQRLPAPNAHPAIVDLVLARPLSPAARAVIEARDAIGLARYGTRLQPFNGRDVERDLTDEAADAVNYAMQGIAQAQDDAARARWERRFSMAVGLLEECVGEGATVDGSLFSLASAQALLERTKHAGPNPEHQADLWVELREACDEVDGLRAQVSAVESESAGFVALYDALGEAIEAHLPGGPPRLIDCVANAGADLAQARATIDALNACTAQQAAAINALHSRVAEFGAAIGVPPGEPLDVLIRAAYEVIALQRRVAGLEEERDDANQRVARKVAGQVRGKAKRSIAPKGIRYADGTRAKSTIPRKGGR